MAGVPTHAAADSIVIARPAAASTTATTTTPPPSQQHGGGANDDNDVDDDDDEDAAGSRGTNAKARGYATGLLFIALVSVIWTASSVLLQYIYAANNNGDDDNNNNNNTTDTDDDDTNDHGGASSPHARHHVTPFMVTYIGVSLFTLWLPAQKMLARCCPRASGAHPRPERSRSTAAADLPAYRTVPSHPRDADAGEAETNTTTAALDDGLCASPPPPPCDDGHGTGGALAVAAAVPRRHRRRRHRQGAAWTDAEHARAAACIAPVWFAANWAYNASLAETSVTSSTVLASTGALFTYAFAVAARDERCASAKLAGVVLGVAGSAVTAFHDADSAAARLLSLPPPPHIHRYMAAAAACPGNAGGDCPAARRLRFVGDVLGLLSAVGYGAYAVQTRVLCPKDEKLYSMQTLLGYIGLWNCVLLSPVALYQMVWAQTTHLAWTFVGFLVVKGLLDNVLSDYLWLRAVMLTNATTATVGLGLTIPLAFASDWLLGQANVLTVGQVVGALAVLVGFVLVNFGNASRVDDDDDDDNGLLHDVDGIGAQRVEYSPISDSDESQRGQEVVILPDGKGMA